MLQIDYSLITLTDKDWEIVRREVQAKLRQGIVPEISKNMHGRVVVVNPDPVQTDHHLPDNLRAPLRRLLVHTQEGPVAIPAARLVDSVCEGEEQLFGLIIEVQSDFKNLHDFLAYIPRLRKKYPRMAVFILGLTPNMLAKMREVLDPKDIILMLHYQDARGTIEIEDGAEISQAKAEREESPTFDLPFFSQIRVALPNQPKPVAMNLDTLKKLHPTYGVGVVREAETGGGRKEKVYVLDLPLRIIRDFLFRQDRGLDFHGVQIKGRTILSRDFEREKLEFRWIPLNSLDGIIRKEPGKAEQLISFKEMRVLRVNTFNGQVSFINRQANQQISFHDIKNLSFKFKPNFKEITPLGGGLKDNLTGVLADVEKIVLTDNPYSKDNIQQVMRDHYFGQIFQVDEERNQKLHAYAHRLKVGAVGQLAGQTLKLLRRYGLERLIDPSGFHYLCDTPEELNTYEQTPERFQKHFEALVAKLTHIAEAHATSHVRLDDVTHQMPIVTEWIDIKEHHFHKVPTSSLYAAYQEIKILIDFVDHEFRRNYRELGAEDMDFFNTIRSCQEVALTIKWLADFKNGAYGPPFPAGNTPDVVFFGTPQEKTTNDHYFFFPAIACSELFADPGNKELFQKGDVAFSIFLEEQLALADHFARESGLPRADTPTFEAYFQQRILEAETHLNELNQALRTMDHTASPEYQAILKQEEENYHRKYGEFMALQGRIGGQHQEAEQAFQDTMLQIGPLLVLPDKPDPAWLAPGEPNPRLYSDFVVQGAKTSKQRMEEALRKKLLAVGEVLMKRTEELKALVAAMDASYQNYVALRVAETDNKLVQAAKAQQGNASARLAVIKGLKREELEGHAKRYQAQQAQLNSDLAQMEARIKLQFERTRQALTTLRHAVERADMSFKQVLRPEKATDLGQLFATLETQAQRSAELAHSLKTNGEKFQLEQQRVDQALESKFKSYEGMYKLRIDLALMQSMLENQPPQAPDLAPPATMDAQQMAQREQTAKESNAALAAHMNRMSLMTATLPALQQAQQETSRFTAFEGQLEALQKLASRKERLRISSQALQDRVVLMDKELSDLPRKVQEQFMPARKALLINIFIPESERIINNYRRAKNFIRELLNLPQERLQSLYLNRTVFRRFTSRQFVKGLLIYGDPESPSFRHLSNNLPAISLFLRTLQFNYEKSHPQLTGEVTLDRQNPIPPPVIWDMIQQIAAKGIAHPIRYIILPPTMSFDQAVRLMNQKDRLYRGIPMLVLIYLSKYDPALLLQNARLKDEYFQATKHNVIINVDNRLLVDNPIAISKRLLEETLGSTSDTPTIEDLPDAADSVTKV